MKYPEGHKYRRVFKADICKGRKASRWTAEVEILTGYTHIKQGPQIQATAFFPRSIRQVDQLALHLQ